MWGARERPNGWTLNSCIFPLNANLRYSMYWGLIWMRKYASFRSIEVTQSQLSNEAGIWVSAFWTYFLRYLFKTMRSRISRISNASFKWKNTIWRTPSLIPLLVPSASFRRRNPLPNFCIISLKYRLFLSVLRNKRGKGRAAAAWAQDFHCQEGGCFSWS